METGPAILWASVIVAFGLIVSAWLISTDGYERCLVLHGGDEPRCSREYPTPMREAGPSPAPTEALQ